MAEENNNDERIHAPAPESVDQTKSTVTGEQIKAMEEAAPQPSRGGEHEEHHKSEKKPAKK